MASLPQPEAQAELLCLRGLGKRMGDRRLVQRLDLTLAPGDALAVIGANGSGKSTLLRLMAGSLRPDLGEVRWFGSASRSAHVRRRIGYLGHASFLFSGLTARENLTYYARLYRVPGAQGRVDALLEQVGLTRVAHRPVATLSRGMGQRLALARALLPEPQLLLLDEPETGLDAAGRDLLIGLLAAHREGGGALVVASHDLPLAARLAPRAVLLTGSGQVLLGEPGPRGELWQAAMSGGAAP